MIASFASQSHIRAPLPRWAIQELTVTILWQYPGLSATKMANEITERSEFLTLQFVVDFKRMESRIIFGIGMMRLYFHPKVDIDRALAQVTAVSQTILKKMPVGTTEACRRSM